LTSALDRDEWLASCSKHFTPEERATDTHTGKRDQSGLSGDEEKIVPAPVWNRNL